MGVKTVYIEPGSLWNNSFYESFNDTSTDNLLTSEYLYSLKEAQIIVREWVRKMTDENLFRDNHVRPHSSRLSTPAPQPSTITDLQTTNYY